MSTKKYFCIHAYNTIMEEYVEVIINPDTKQISFFNDFHTPPRAYLVLEQVAGAEITQIHLGDVHGDVRLVDLDFIYETPDGEERYLAHHEPDSSEYKALTEKILYIVEHWDILQLVNI